MRFEARRLRPLLAALLLAGLAACASGPAPRDHFYRLQVPAPASPRAEPALPGVVEVDRPRADHLVRERAILRSEGEEAAEVTPYVYHLWVDSPTSMVQRELARWLERSGTASRAVLPEPGVSARWRVTGRLERLEHVPSRREVLVVLELRLRDQQSGRLRLQKRYTAAVAADATVDAAVASFGAALGSIFEQFAAEAAAAR